MAFVQHIPVMVEVVAKLLLTRGNGFYVDATIGTGGHTAYLLKQGGEGMRILGVDRDAKALGEAQRRLGPLGNNVTFVIGNFRHIRQLTKGRQCDGFLLDLGLSSFQLSDPERGFSYLQEGPLDMSMGGDGRSVGELLATADERELGRILKDYGEERRYRAIAREIVQTRSLKRLTGTSQLRKIVENVVPARTLMSSLSRVFQAFRIWANDELESLRECLPQAVELLLPGGRLAVISYHSLEDRIVKQFFRQEEKGCICPPEFPECCCGRVSKLKVVTRRPVRPSPAEIVKNPRARSAKLRVAERI